MTQSLLSSNEAAEALGVSVSTIIRWSQSGKLPATHRLPGQTGALLFERSAVRELVDQQAAEVAGRREMLDGAAS